MAAHKNVLRGRSGPTIITPHEGEFRRLYGEIEENRVIRASELAKDLDVTVLLKGPSILLFWHTTHHHSASWTKSKRLLTMQTLQDMQTIFTIFPTQHSLSLSHTVVVQWNLPMYSTA